MSGSVNKVLEGAISRYADGESIPQIADDLGIGRGILRYQLHKRDMLRSREEGIRLAAKDGRLGSGLRGKRRIFSDEHCSNISKSRQRWADAGNAIGITTKPSGYVEYTRGEHKGRAVHVIAMEARLGRGLRCDENIHHIDGDKTNNEENNLALVTKSGHARLHRREEVLAGNVRERKENGRFC